MNYTATQDARITVNGRSIDLKAGEPCDVTLEEAMMVPPGLLATSAHSEASTIPSVDDEEPRFERKKAKK